MVADAAVAAQKARDITAVALKYKDKPHTVLDEWQAALLEGEQREKEMKAVRQATFLSEMVFGEGEG